MKQLTKLTTRLSIMLVMLLSPIIAMAQPAGPPSTDPFAAPVNGGLVFVVTIAFLYGVYRIYRMTKARHGNINQ